MTKMFGNLTAEKLETPEDRLGGGFEPIPSNIYDGTLKLAFAGKARNSDAQNVTLHVDVNGKEVRETIYITNRSGENFFVDKNTGKNVPLPGYTLIDDICLFCTEQGLPAQDTEEKTVKLYDFDERKELPKQVQVLTGLLNKPVQLGILREIVDKNQRGDDGNYHPTGETRTQNAIDKAFHPETGRTVNEYRHEVETPEFRDAWIKQNQDKDRNKAKGVQGGAGTTGTGAPGAGNGGAKKSLFGN